MAIFDAYSHSKIADALKDTFYFGIMKAKGELYFLISTNQSFLTIFFKKLKRFA